MKFHEPYMNLNVLRSGLKILLVVIFACEQVKAETPQDTYWTHSTFSQSADASDVALPVLSLLLPGAGQWLRGQWTSAATYTGGSMAAIGFALAAKEQAGSSEITFSKISDSSVAERKYLLGTQTYQALGGLSLYHTFRSAVWQRQKYGEYGFLGSGESPIDLIKAPFRFEFLQRSSTYIPLGVAALASYYIANHPMDGHVKKFLSREDPWFAGAFSYNAGVHEEAVFRGWLMPLLHQAGMSKTSSNLTQAGTFALAHLGSTSLPLPQFLLGLHFGQTAMNNHWSISESIFIHTWWDVMVLLATFHTKEREPAANRRASLYLPPLQLFF
jgi:membrane protease YdiL (CAAX protease family)